MQAKLIITYFEGKPNMDCELFCFDTYENYLSLEYKAELIYGCKNCITKLISLIIDNPEKKISEILESVLIADDINGDDNID